MPGPVPPDVASDCDEGDFGPPDPHDVDDEEGDGGGAAGPSRTRPTDPLERFIPELENLSSMDGPDILGALADLPVLPCPAAEGGYVWYIYARGRGGML